jgi:hypothetical protein
MRSGVRSTASEPSFCTSRSVSVRASMPPSHAPKIKSIQPVGARSPHPPPRHSFWASSTSVLSSVSCGVSSGPMKPLVARQSIGPMMSGTITGSGTPHTTNVSRHARQAGSAISGGYGPPLCSPVATTSSPLAARRDKSDTRHQAKFRRESTTSAGPDRNPHHEGPGPPTMTLEYRRRPALRTMLTSVLSSTAGEHQEYTDESDERRTEREVRADSDYGPVFGIWAPGARVVLGLQSLHAALVARVHSLEPPHARVLARRAVERAGTRWHPKTTRGNSGSPRHRSRNSRADHPCLPAVIGSHWRRISSAVHLLVRASNVNRVWRPLKACGAWRPYEFSLRMLADIRPISRAASVAGRRPERTPRLHMRPPRLRQSPCLRRTCHRRE